MIHSANGNAAGTRNDGKATLAVAGTSRGNAWGAPMAKDQSGDSGSGEILRFEGFTLDLDGHALTDAAGQDVPLTPAEFGLLAAFVRGAGRALSRDHLLQAVAGRESEASDRSVDVLVGRLRRKIETDPKAPRLIVTVPGVGYKFATRAAPAPLAPVAEADRPSLAVLPFANLSGDPEQDYFADGIVEELTNALSRVRWFFVIARNSSFTYKGRAVDVRQVGRELGVRYVLEGSVRKAGGRVRIAAELVETEAGAHVWADRFDGVVDDIFDLQDTITASVVGAIEPRLRDAELARTKRQRPGNPTAYDYFLRGLASFYLETREGTQETLRFLAQAMESDPSFAPPYTLAAECLVARLDNTWSADREEEKREAERLARAALALDKNDPTVLAFAGHVLAYAAHDYSTGLALIERSLALNPNSPRVFQLGGYTHLYAGDPNQAIELFRQGLRVGPLDARCFILFSGLACALTMLGRDEEALMWANKSVASSASWAPGLRMQACALAHLGRMEEARAVAARVMQTWPGYRVSNVRQLIQAGPGLDRYLDGLLRAGLPD